MQEQLEDTDDDEEDALDETSSVGHVVNAYQWLQVMSKTNTEKKSQKKNDRYNIKSKGDPPTLGEMQEKVRVLIKKAGPPATPRQKTQSKFGKTVADNTTSKSFKLQNTSPDNTDIHSILDTSVSLPTLDNNIIEDMKKIEWTLVCLS